MQRPDVHPAARFFADLLGFTGRPGCYWHGDVDWDPDAGLTTEFRWAKGLNPHGGQVLNVEVGPAYIGAYIWDGREGRIVLSIESGPDPGYP